MVWEAWRQVKANYNASRKFLAPENAGSYFIDRTLEEVFASHYQVLDQIIASRRGTTQPYGEG
jgi:hypothetical protein